MRITSVSYSALKITKQYENERVEATVEIYEGEDPDEGFRKAKMFVLRQLGQTPTQEEYEAAKAIVEMREFKGWWAP